jgi:hypothetical protein
MTDVGGPPPLRKSPSLKRHSTQLRRLTAVLALATPRGQIPDVL